ncbi:MAG: hypothetical protein KC416_02985, partial [Myxococcales bacterium]|nr:hypothetical protein [Myxococcales bacterium]
EGLGVAVTAHCPEGYRLAEAPRPVYLRTVTALGSDQLEPIEMSVSCMPTKRRAVVVVSTGEDGAGLPVLLDGLEVIKTDDAGVAHLRFTGTPSTPFRVTVDTSSNEDLKPPNPTRSFQVKDEDEIFILDRKLVNDKEPPPPPKRQPRKRRRRSAPSGPIKL